MPESTSRKVFAKLTQAEATPRNEVAISGPLGSTCSLLYSASNSGIEKREMFCPPVAGEYSGYLSNGGDWNIHDNAWDLNSCDNCLWLINNNRRLDRVWNNQFTGQLNSVGGTSANCTGLEAQERRGGTTLLRGSLRTFTGDPVARAVVTIPGRPITYTTSPSGDWVLWFPASQPTG